MATEFKADTVDILSRPADGTSERDLWMMNALLRARVKRIEGFNAELSVEVDRLRDINKQLTKEMREMAR